MRPKWTKSFNFQLDWGTGMPIKALNLWENNLRFLEELLKKYKLDLVQVYIHWHKDPDEIHYCGVTWMDERRMAFCAGNDKETMLHEVAHLMMMYPEHDELWSDQLLTLHKDNLTAKELRVADAEPSPEAGSLTSEHMLTLQSEQIESCWECGQRDQGEYENSSGRFYCNACWIDYRTHLHILARMPDIWNRWRLHARIFRPDEVRVLSPAPQRHLRTTLGIRIPEIPPAGHTLDSHISARWQMWLSRFPFTPGAGGEDDKYSRTWHFQKRYRPLIIAFLVWAAGDVFHYPYWSPYDVWHSNGLGF